jgi:hypothetical protein
VTIERTTLSDGSTRIVERNDEHGFVLVGRSFED